MKRIIILLFVTLSLAAISAPTDSVQKTVPLTQEQFDSLSHAAALSAQQETVARETANEVLEHYTGTVAWMISILGILISIVAIVAPILINFSYKKQLEKQIEEQHNKFEDRVRNQFNSQNKNLQGRIVNHENIINQNNEKIQQLNKEMLQSQKKSEDAAEEAQISALFSQAYYEDNLDKQIPIYSEIIDRLSNSNDRTEALTQYLAKAYNNRGIAYDNKGEFNKAIEDYNKAIELNPNDAEAYNNRALCYIKLAEKETDKAEAKEYYQKALDDCNTGLSLNPDEEVRKALEAKKQHCEEKLNDLQA